MRGTKGFYQISELHDSEEDGLGLFMGRNYITERLLVRLKKHLFTCLPRSRIKSGTRKYPTAQDVFQASIDVLTKLGDDHIVYFRIKRRSWWAIVEWNKMSVKLSEGAYSISIKFPPENPPERVFEDNKIRISEGWTIEKSGGRWATLHVKRAHEETIAPFLESIYEKFYSECGDYRLIGDINLTEEALFWENFSIRLLLE